MKLFEVRDEIKKILELDVTDIDTLSLHGYDPSNYYAGPWQWMSLLTKIRNHLRQQGMVFPFNPAAFKHDLGYALKPNLYEKYLLDKAFNRDMKIIIEKSDFEQVIKDGLQARRRIYYAFVIVCTPIYLFKGKVNFKNN